MSTLLLNIGNTNTQLARLASNNELRQLGSVPTAGLPDCDLLVELEHGPGLAACVVPAMRETLGSRYSQLRFLSLLDVPFVDFSRVDPGTLGGDRLANLAAAADLGGPVLVLDCGTAITTEALAAGNVFLGGAILPGRRLLRHALHDHTAQLPLVPLGTDLPPALGIDTKNAILAGTDAAVLGAVDRIIRSSRQEMGAPACPVLAVGGDAPYFVRHLPEVEAGPADFTLRGLAAAVTRRPRR